MVENLFSDTNIVKGSSAWEEGSLIVRDEHGHDRPKTIGKDLKDELIQDIA